MTNLKDEYEVLFDEYTGEDIARIKLTSGKWDGIIYAYHTIGFVEQEDDDAILKFEYDVIQTPEELDVESLTEEDKKEFENHLGDILVSIIEETTADEVGANDNKQSDI